jgi:hypothetical protein
MEIRLCLRQEKNSLPNSLYPQAQRSFSVLRNSEAFLFSEFLSSIIFNRMVHL